MDVTIDVPKNSFVNIISLSFHIQNRSPELDKSELEELWSTCATSIPQNNSQNSHKSVFIIHTELSLYSFKTHV